MSGISFDFGKKPVTDGYTKVLGNTLYDESKGYGIEKLTDAFERGVGEKELLRDGLLFGGNSFKAKIDNGTYMVRLCSGDYVDEGDLVTKFDINGVKTGVWVYDGTVQERIITVDVTDGFIRVSCAEGKHPCINALEASPKRDIAMGAVSASVDAKKSGSTVTLSWDELDGVIGYRVYKKTLKNRETVIAADVPMAEFTDHDVEICEDYEYTVTGLYGHKFETMPADTVSVKVVDGKELTAKVTELNIIETPNTVALNWKPVEGALWYNVYQKAPYGLYKFIDRNYDCDYIDDKVVTNVEYIYAVEAVTLSGITERAEAKTNIIEKPYIPKAESLSRGGIAIKTEDGVFLSWRLNAYEYKRGYDFIIERNGERITKYPITDSTNYLDKDGKEGDTYTIKAVLENKVEKTGQTVTVNPDPYYTIPLDKPAPITLEDGVTYNYTANDAAVGDVDGDGEYEIVLRWDANGKDNSHKGFTGNVLLDAYKLTGEKLWRIDLGRNIRAGSHYTQMMVYDLNNDGCAELVCKTADGTVDGVGTVIGDPAANYRNKDGFIIEGPEYLTVFDGKTGAAIDTVDYTPPRGDVSEWGDSWGNRVDRFLACIAYLDGVNPSVVMCRGYYDHGRPTNLVAYDMIDNKLVKRWHFRADKNQNIEYTNQGNHNLAVGDIDGDGMDEIVYGAMAVDQDGTGIYSTGFGHGDCLNLGKFMPDEEGLQYFQIHEDFDAEYGYEVRDPATGEVKWGFFTGKDTTRGLTAKIDPRYKGCQVWVMDDHLYTFDGEIIADKCPDSINFGIWWDGDLLRELLDGEFDKEIGGGYPRIYKWDYENNKLVTILAPEGTLTNNWMKRTPCIQADLFGDWREEAVWRNSDDTELRIYTTTDITEHKMYTLMHDHVYRMSVACQNSAYNQCPQTGFYIGPEMTDIPVPELDYVNGTDDPEWEEL